MVSLFEDGSKRRDTNAAGDEDIFFLRVAHDEVAVQIRDLDGVAGLERFERFFERAALLHGEAGGDHNMAFVRRGGDGEPTVRAAIIGGRVVEDAMQELSGLPNERCFRRENK